MDGMLAALDALMADWVDVHVRCFGFFGEYTEIKRILLGEEIGI